MTTPIRVLILEGQETDAELMLRELRRVEIEPEWQRVETEGDYLKALESVHELILADFNLPQLSGQRALELLVERQLDIPFILVSGTVGEETAVDMIKLGAADYVLKDRMTRLGQAVLRALEDKRLQREKKLAEDNLRESEIRYWTILENIEDGYYEVDLEGNLTFFNDSSIGILGYDKNELMGMNNRQYMSPETSKVVYQAFNKVYTTGNPVQILDCKIIRKDGILRNIESSISPIMVADGSTVGFRGIMRDITARREAEQTRLESEERYRSVVEYSHNGIVIIDDEFKFEYANDLLCQILGRSREEIIGHDFTEFLDEQSQKLVVDRYLMRQQGEDVVAQYEIKVNRKDGEKRIVEISSAIVRDSKGKARTIGQIMDITERLQAEKALVEANTIIKRSPAVAFLWKNEKDWPVEFVSENVGMIFGYSAQDFLEGKYLYSQLVHSDDLARVETDVESSGKKEEQQESNIWCHRRER